MVLWQAAEFIVIAYLRCNIQGSTKFVEKALSFRAEVTSSKVNDLDDGICVSAGQHDVLRFEVSVGEAFAVHKGQKLHQAAHQLGCFLFTVMFLWGRQDRCLMVVDRLSTCVECARQPAMCYWLRR